jgi:endonuclease-8
MPEGDTIYRAARALHAALAGQYIVRFESVFAQLTRVNADRPIAGRRVERVEARGKHLLMWLDGGRPPEGRAIRHCPSEAEPGPAVQGGASLVLRTHMRMHGSWHIYRPGERWQRPRHDMRITIETDAFHAIGFSIPIAELTTSRELERTEPLLQLGPDILADDFDVGEAVTRLRARADVEIADALLDQTALAGIGNVYKSEVLFAARVSPFTPVAGVTDEQLRAIIAIASRFLRANVPGKTRGPSQAQDTDGIVTYTGLRRTTGRSDPSARLWVYGRAGKPCRRCGTPISRRKQGPHARSTYWCPRCQAAA